MTVEVTDHPDRGRYEVTVDGLSVGHADYVLAGDVITLTHTEIGPAHQRQGFGSVLVRHCLDDARQRSLRVIPLCPFVSAWLARHPDYADVVYA